MVRMVFSFRHFGPLDSLHLFDLHFLSSAVVGGGTGVGWYQVVRLPTFFLRNSDRCVSPSLQIDLDAWWLAPKTPPVTGLNFQQNLNFETGEFRSSFSTGVDASHALEPGV